MHFDERAEGNYRIYAGAVEAKGGYVAAVVVKQIKGAANMPDVYRDLNMSGGHRWATPRQALDFAMAAATQVIHTGGLLKAA